MACNFQATSVVSCDGQKGPTVVLSEESSGDEDNGVACVV